MIQKTMRIENDVSFKYGAKAARARDEGKLGQGRVEGMSEARDKKAGESQAQTWPRLYSRLAHQPTPPLIPNPSSPRQPSGWISLSLLALPRRWNSSSWVWHTKPFIAQFLTYLLPCSPLSPTTNHILQPDKITQHWPNTRAFSSASNSPIFLHMTHTGYKAFSLPGLS